MQTQADGNHIYTWEEFCAEVMAIPLPESPKVPGNQSPIISVISALPRSRFDDWQVRD